MEIAQLVAKRSTCVKAHVGAVIVKGGRIIATGYNGAPSGLDHCLDKGCLLDEQGHCQRCVHAEVATISFSARYGVPLEGSTLYITHAPCIHCAKVIVNSGIEAVIYQHPYNDVGGVIMLGKAGITVYEYVGYPTFLVHPKKRESRGTFDE